MNMYLREMKAYRKLLIIWCIGVFYIVAASMWKFGTEYSGNQSLNELVTQLPAAVKVLLGLRGAFDLSTAAGYYGLCYYYLVVMGTIHAAMIGAGVIAKEESDKTTEFLIVKPVSRSRILTAKLSAGFSNVLALNIMTGISSILMVGYFNDGETFAREIMNLMAGMLMLQSIFMVTGAGIAAMGRNPKSASPLAIVALLISLMMAKMIDMNPNLDGLKYFTPIKYFEAEQLLFQGGFSSIFVLLSTIIIALLLRMTYVSYRTRDLKV